MGMTKDPSTLLLFPFNAADTSASAPPSLLLRLHASWASPVGGMQGKEQA
jgi:hypothetical protein